MYHIYRSNTYRPYGSMFLHAIPPYPTPPTFALISQPTRTLPAALSSPGAPAQEPPARNPARNPNDCTDIEGTHSKPMLSCQPQVSEMTFAAVTHNVWPLLAPAYAASPAIDARVALTVSDFTVPDLLSVSSCRISTSTSAT